MENYDTVTLSLNEYNKLRDFKKNVEEGNLVCISRVTSTYDCHYYYSKDEKILDEIQKIKKIHDRGVERCENHNKRDKEKILKMEIDIKTLSIERNNIEKELNNTISYIKQMSIWEFLKYRKR